MITLEQAFAMALEKECDRGEHGELRIVVASERPEAWGFTLRNPEYWFSPSYTFFISKDDGHKFDGPPVPPLENLEWWQRSHRIELPERPDGRVIQMAEADPEAVYRF